jgi:hypothetical protein
MLKLHGKWSRKGDTVGKAAYGVLPLPVTSKSKGCADKGSIFQRVFANESTPAQGR